MKAWGWISMRISLEDAVKNAFEETTMKNVPIDQFWSFKWRNRVQNWNLREKLSKIGPVGNFDFWSKVNIKSQSQLVQGQSQRILIRVGSGSPGRVTSRAVDVERWCHPMTSDDISSRFLRVEEKSETQVARGGACKSGWHQILRPSRSVDEEAVMAARVHEHDLEVKNLRRRVVDFSELTAACGDAWLAFGWPDFWVFLAGGLGARLWGRFQQAKAWCAQIW